MRHYLKVSVPPLPHPNNLKMKKSDFEWPPRWFSRKIKRAYNWPLHLVTKFDPLNWKDMQQLCCIKEHMILNCFSNILTKSLKMKDPIFFKSLKSGNDLKINISKRVHNRPNHPLAIWQRISQKKKRATISKIIHLVNIQGSTLTVAFGPGHVCHYGKWNHKLTGPIGQVEISLKNIMKII